MMASPTVDTELLSCSVLELIQHANREQVAYHLVDDRLIVHPHRTRQEIADAMIARGEEVADFLRTYRRHEWRTPSEERAYREQVAADEMCLELFSMPWEVCKALMVAHFAEVVGEAWERHVARIAPSAISDQHDGEQCACRGGGR